MSSTAYGSPIVSQGRRERNPTTLECYADDLLAGQYSIEAGARTGA